MVIFPSASDIPNTLSSSRLAETLNAFSTSRSVYEQQPQSYRPSGVQGHVLFLPMSPPTRQGPAHERTRKTKEES